MLSFTPLQTLTNNPLFERLTVDTCQLVLSELDVRTIQVNEPLMLTSPPDMHYLIPMTNNLVLYRTKTKRFGMRLPLGVLWPIRLSPGETVEIRSIATGKYSSDSGVVGLVPERVVGQWVIENPELRATFLQALCQSDTMLLQELEQYSCNGLTGRVARLLLDLHEVSEGEDIYYRQAEIADLLNVQRESISIIIGRFRTGGWITTKYGSIRVAEPLSLRRIADSY